MRRIDLSRVTQVLRGFYHKHKRPPSYEEVRRLFGYRSKNAAFWLMGRLREKGIVSRDGRGKLILEAAGGVRLLGTVQAGFPSPAEEELIDTVSLDEYLVAHPEKTYLIKVTGDSMEGAGIREGDLVLVERGRTARNGDIVVAQVDGEWTMKFYEKRGSKVRLNAANERYPSLFPKTELVIGGVVTAVVRKYK